jgi:hypothetical protein
MARSSYQRLKSSCHFSLAVIILLWPSLVFSQSRQAGELAVQSGFDLVGRKKLPTLSELEALLTKENKLRGLITGRIKVPGTSVYAPRWSRSKEKFGLAFQQADLKKEQSKVVIQPGLQIAPRALINDEFSYESMLIWAVGASLEKGPGFGVVSNVTGSSQVHVGSLDGGEPIAISDSDSTKRHPATAISKSADGTRVQVVYDAGKDLVARTIQKFPLLNPKEDKRLVLSQGTQARWSLKGQQLIYIRELYGDGENRDQVERQEVVILTYQLSAPIVVYAGEKGQILRSPIFSPDCTHVAFYARRKGVDPIWDLYVCDIRSQLNKPVLIGQDLVINTVFEHVGPAWSGDSKSLYYFSNKDREEEYYPILRVSRDGKARQKIQYQKHINVANDIHARSWRRGDFIVFTGIDRGPRELYFIVMPKARTSPIKAGKKEREKK